MLINKTYFIDSCDDVELNIKRESKLEYRITYDDEKEMKAVVFVIGGYGANANIHFLDSYRKFIAKKFNVVTINVFYHCFCQRKSDVERYSAREIFLEEDLPNLKLILENFKLQTSKLDTSTASIHYDALNQTISDLKEKNLLDQDFKAHLYGSYIPPNNEYQNFGIMAAIDHINALKDILNKYPQFKTLPKIYGGGSYGGYLALMCAKIAPWYVDGVIDNSGAALPPLHYIVGRDINGYDYKANNANAIVYGIVKTHWQRKNLNSPYYFADENYLIRALLNQTHLILQTQKNKDIVYISYHSKKDPATPADYKISMVEILKALNYEVDFHLIEEKDIDGKYIKDLEHGCGIPDKALFNKELPNMLEKLKGKEFSIREDSISYPCKDKVFTFKDKDDKFVLELL
ncbi:DUF2920 family protein [Campylobacter insulaenigrae]|uniref:DUF2920 family protein n=1 Tax=Campylobacter insulaenigrae TaxID=260714 RepID=UPI00215257D5|nr:DUF2920 family protein [Campylobacter insulaenigrae]MCR6572459.1 DUF2920 family protein [Campylobacter insulaenigrae]